MRRFFLFSVALVALMGCTTSGPASSTLGFGRCDIGDLEMQLIGGGVAAGSFKEAIEVRNRSSHDCDLYGYAGIQLLSAYRLPLPTKVIWSTDAFFLTTPAVVEIVELPAGTGRAYIPLSFSGVQEPCSQAALLRVTPPGASASLVIPGDLFVCSGGTLTVNPVTGRWTP